MIDVKRELLRSSGPHLLLKPDHLEQVAQHHVQTAFQYLQGWRFHILSGIPVLVLIHSHSEDVFSDVQREPPVFHFVPVAFGPVTVHHCAPYWCALRGP